MKKYLMLLACFSNLSLLAVGQTIYDNNESEPHMIIKYSDGIYSRAVANPNLNGTNKSTHVSKLIRSSNRFDALIFNAKTYVDDIKPYFGKETPKKMSVDFYSEYPGTDVYLILSNAAKATQLYPIGRHSTYHAITTKKNEWETLTFELESIPDPGVSPFEINQFNFMIDSNDDSAANREYYFDNFKGPEYVIPSPSIVVYDDADSVLLGSYSSQGVLNRKFTNPDAANKSLVIKYGRTSDKFDDITFDINKIVYSVNDYLRGKKKMTLQVYSQYPGTEITLMLANTDLYKGRGYPAGRHSVYHAFTSQKNKWETLEFNFEYSPDPTVSPIGINRIYISIAPGKSLPGLFYLDNFCGPDIFIPDGTPKIQINEIQSSNTKGITSLDGTTSDWIELVNSGTGTAYLNNYSISKDTTKFPVPNMFVSPKEHVLLWASGIDSTYFNGEIHLNFTISKEGNKLLLSNAQGDSVDYFPSVFLTENKSFGRKTDGVAELVYFLDPTPGKANITTPYSGLVTTLPEFSHKGGFYANPVDLSVSTSLPGGVIRYTTDGSDPVETSPLLNGSLLIDNRTMESNRWSNIRTTYYSEWMAPVVNQFKSTALKARVFKNGFIPGPVVTNSYFVDKDMMSRYNIPVWSIVTDSANLFSNDKGIYVPGKLYDDWKKTHPTDIVDGDTPNNYNARGLDWEREASLEFFEPDGSKGFKHNAGIRLHGGWSRGKPQKALAVYFRSQYDTVKKLEYPLFPGLKKMTDGKPLEKFNSFLLKVSGNDNNSTMIRDAVSHIILKPNGLATQAYRPSVVFMNGEYWGIHNIREKITKDFLSNHFNVESKDVAILAAKALLEEGTEEDVNDYVALEEYIKNNDVSKTEVFDQVSKRMDVLNFIDYNAAEIFLANTDWPGNNIFFWKTRKGNASSSVPGQDGRWRWILQDTDFGMGWENTPDHNTLQFATELNADHWPNPEWSTFLLRNMLKNEYFKNTFINRFADQLNSSFKIERVSAIIDSIEGLIAPAMQEHINRWNEIGDLYDWKAEINLMKNFAVKRPAIQRQHILEFFKLSDSLNVTVNVNDVKGGEVKISSLRINKNLPGVNVSQVYPWTGIYFKDVPITISAIANAGYRFIGWNGHVSNSVDTTITLKDALNLVAHFELLKSDDLYPVAHVLSKGRYDMTKWDNVSEAGTYPKSMIFMQSDVVDPKLNTSMTHPYTDAYNLDSHTRVEGLNETGFAFINTGSLANPSDSLSGGRDLGSAILAINTQGVDKGYVSFTAWTVVPNVREYAIRLQYRVGATGAFSDIVENGNPVEYSKQAAGESKRFLNVELPVEALDKEYVQLRWVYYYVSGISGARPKLAIDDIVVSTDLTSAIEEQAAATSLKVYPNPSSDLINFNISSDYKGSVSISITDLFGKTVYSSIINKPDYSLIWNANHNFNDGIYFINWQAGDRRGVERLVVIKK